MKKKGLIIPVLVLGATLAAFGFSTKASAMSLSSFFGFKDNNDSLNANVDMQGDFRGEPNMGNHGVFGTVTAINGSTITVQSKANTKSENDSENNSGQAAVTTTYTVNVGSAPITKNGVVSTLSAVAVGDTVVVQGTVSGTTVTATKINDGVMPSTMGRGIFGTVTAINGSTLTVQSKTFTKGNTSSTATIYTVNASSATIMKANVASTLSAIAVGDTVMVQGTVSGTSVTAARVDDGVMMKGVHPTPGHTQTSIGNGQPIVGGKVTAVSGNIVTITNNSNASYAIDVTNAKITKNDKTIPTSSIAVGDQVIAQGTINGSAVTAVSLTDGVSANVADNNGEHKGLFGSIGSFFSHLFGF